MDKMCNYWKIGAIITYFGAIIAGFSAIQYFI